MLFTSPVYSQASGSIAGITYSHNRGGMYTRARVTPTDPSSQRQQAMRAIMGVLAPYWGNTLTQAQRDDWNLYGANVPWLNPLGQTIFLTGQQHFNRINTVYLQIGEAIQPVAPIIFDLGTFTQPVLVQAQVVDNYTISYDNTDAWANGAGGFLVAYGGKAIGPGRAFYRGPYRLSGSEAGDAVPPVSPFIGTSFYPLSLDNQFWCQIRIIQTDGRLSLPVILGPVTITP